MRTTNLNPRPRWAWIILLAVLSIMTSGSLLTAVTGCGSSVSGSHLNNGGGDTGNPGDPGNPPPPPSGGGTTTDHVFVLTSDHNLGSKVDLLVGFQGDQDETAFRMEPNSNGQGQDYSVTVKEKDKRAHAFVLSSGKYVSPEENGLRLYRDGDEITDMVDNEGRHDFSWDPSNMGSQNPPPGGGTVDSFTADLMFQSGMNWHDVNFDIGDGAWGDSYRVVGAHNMASQGGGHYELLDTEIHAGDWFGYMQYADDRGDKHTIDGTNADQGNVITITDVDGKPFRIVWFLEVGNEDEKIIVDGTDRKGHFGWKVDNTGHYHAPTPTFKDVHGITRHMYCGYGVPKELCQGIPYKN